MKRFEYCIANTNMGDWRKGLSEELTRLGNEGWRAVEFKIDPEVVLMEREIPEPKPQLAVWTYKIIEENSKDKFESELNWATGRLGYEVQEISAARFRAVLRKRQQPDQ